MGDFERAEQDYQQAIALNPDYLRAARNNDRADHQGGAIELKLSGPSIVGADEIDLPGRQ